MRLTTVRYSAGFVAALLAGILMATLAQAGEFQSASSVDETRAMIEALPDNDVWWTANGAQMRWNNKNLQRFMPAVTVYRGGLVRELKYNIDPRIGAFALDIGETAVSFADFLQRSEMTTMAVVILKDGEIVFEAYPKQQPYEKPIFWSVTKVFVAGLIAILEDAGRIDTSAPVERYLPALKDSAFAGITVRNILDMATGLDCREDYEDRTSCYYRMAVALGDGFVEDKELDKETDNPYELLPQLKIDRYAEQGTSFAYASVNTFVLGWIVEEITGMPLQDALSQMIWTQMGAEHDAALLAPRYGVPLAWGGLLATPRDVARFGLLHTPSWRLVAQAPIFSEEYIRLLKDGGNPELLRNARWGAPSAEVDHNVYQWDFVFDNNDMYKGGWAGQGLLVNPDKDLVVVYTGYLDDVGNSRALLPLIRRMMNTLYPAANAPRP